MPAFMAAAAASECGGVCEAVGDAETVREASFELVEAMRGCGVADGDGDGGSELRSGGMSRACARYR